jgi:hypothetical protein
LHETAQHILRLEISLRPDELDVVPLARLQSRATLLHQIQALRE